MENGSFSGELTKVDILSYMYKLPFHFEILSGRSIQVLKKMWPFSQETILLMCLLRSVRVLDKIWYISIPGKNQLSPSLTI